jgi:hypothetical protein
MSSSDSATEIRLSANYPVSAKSRVNDSGFTDGDNIGLFVVDQDENAEKAISDGNLRGDNVKFTYSESTERWTGANTLYWKDNKTSANFYAYYPFNSSLTGTSTVSHSVSTNQNEDGNENYTSSDFLYAARKNVNPSTETVDLTFNHALSLMQINLEKGEGFTQDDWDSFRKTVIIKKLITSSSIDLETGAVAIASDDASDIHPLKVSNDEYRAVVVPQTISSGSEIVSVTIDTHSYSLIKSEQISLQQGKKYAFTIVVKRHSSDGDFEFIIKNEEISPWLDTEEFRDGIMRQYVVFTVEKVGTLKDVVEAMNIDCSNVTSAKFVGPLNEDDCYYITDNFKNLKNVHFGEALLMGEPEGYFPTHMFQDYTVLNKIIFPKNLKGFHGQAFLRAGIIGSLIIPEGVEYIGEDAFSDNPTQGSLSLPSTLKYVGDRAFRYSNFTGELIVPDEVTYIGEGAFAVYGFSGNPQIPEKIEYIGEAAFADMRSVYGDIVIPQGLKTVPSRLFASSSYDGNITIPEGVEVISGAAFGSTQICGEVKLPSSLVILGGNAFSGTRITSVIFPDELIQIGRSAFADTRISGSLTLPKGLHVIYDGTFSGCKLLTSVEIPENIIKIGDNAFSGCTQLASIVCHATEPPVIYENTFYGIEKDNFSIEVPEGSVDKYKKANYWKEFKRITAYKNLVCRPSKVCAINNRHTQEIILNADGPWIVQSMPSWCSISAKSGTGKTQLKITIDALTHNSVEKRTGEIVFALTGTDYTTSCSVEQWDYEYEDDAIVTLQTASEGNGQLNVFFLADGYDAEALASGEYINLAKEQMEYFFGIEPYQSLRNYFNVYAAINLSQETGVNTVNTYRDTRFMTIYGSSSEGLVPDEDLVTTYVENAMSQLGKTHRNSSIAILIPNTSEYPASTTIFDDGFAISVCPQTESAYPSDLRGIVQHEACGHAFGKLGDEVIKMNRFAPSAIKSLVDEMHGRGYYLNLSSSGKMADVPWSFLIFDTRYSDEVDVFEGGLNYTRGIYRSESNSCMNYGIPYFNAISRYSIMRRILDYAGVSFDSEYFYSNDTKEWGATTYSGLSRSMNVSHEIVGSRHIFPRFTNKNSTKIKAKIKTNK